MSEGSPHQPGSPGRRHPWEDLGDVQSWVPWGSSTPSTPRNSMPSQPRSPNPVSVDSAQDAGCSSARTFSRVLSGAANLSESDRSLVSAHSSFATTGLVATLLGRQDDKWFLQQEQSRATDSDEHGSFGNSYLSESQTLPVSPSGSRGVATAATHPNQAAARRNIIGTSGSSHRLDEAAGSPSSRRRPPRQPWDDVSIISSRSEQSDKSKARPGRQKQTQTDPGSTSSPQQKVVFVPTSSASSMPDPDRQAGKATVSRAAHSDPKGTAAAPTQARSQKPMLFDSPYDAVARGNGPAEWSRQEDSFASAGSYGRLRGSATAVPRQDEKAPKPSETSGSPSDPRDSFLAASAAAAAASGRRRLSESVSSVSVSEWDQSTLGRSGAESVRAAAAGDESFSSLTAAPWMPRSPKMSLAPQQQQPWSPRTPPPPSSSSPLTPCVTRRASMPASAPPASTLSRTSAATCYSAGTQKEFAALLAREIARELEQDEPTAQTPGMGWRGSPDRDSDIPAEPYVPGMAMRKFREAISSGDSSQTLRGAKRSGLDLIIDIVGKQKHSEKGKRKTPKKKAKAKTPPPAPPIGATKGLVAGVQDGLTSRFSLRCNPRQRSFSRWVFAKDVTAYKAVAAAVTATGDPLYLSIYDGRTCYILGKEAQDTGIGIHVYMSPTEALGEPILSKRKDIVDRFPRLVLKVIVSGRGYQMGNKFAFPFLRPVSVLYPDEIIERPATDMIPPVFGEAMENADQGNVLQTLRGLSLAEQQHG